MTGTPLDLTPFGSILTGIGWLYWLLAIGLLILAIRKPKTTTRKVVWSCVVATVFGLLPGMELHKEYFARTKLRAATTQFEMRCKNAGEKTARTVENVEGVVWMKWRDTKDNLSDQFRMDDPYGRDCGGDDCIAQLLRLDNTDGRFEREVTQRKGRYRYVESVDPGDGQRYRYTGTMKLRPAWTPEAIERFRRDRGTDVPESAYWFQLERKPIASFSAHYGITWDDISTTEDRDHWVAGGSLKVIDLQTKQVIAERAGYMMDRGLGSTAGFRTPWAYARDTACPPFKRADGGGAFASYRAHDFLFKVLQPAKGE